MPMRTIDDKRYKGISELYRKSDGKVTGYYVTYRDAEGKPVKRRVEAETKDEALRELADIRKEIDLQKQGKPMSVLPKEPIRLERAAKAPAKSLPSAVAPLTVQSMHDCQKIISAYGKNAIVLLIDIVAFDGGPGRRGAGDAFHVDPCGVGGGRHFGRPRTRAYGFRTLSSACRPLLSLRQKRLFPSSSRLYRRETA